MGGITLSLFLLALLPLFFIGGPDWADGPLYKATWNLGHIVFFFALTLLARPQRWLGGWWLFIGTTLVAFVAGGVIELLQGSAGREVDWHDMLRNLIGAWLALAWLPWSRQRIQTVRIARLAVMALLLWELGLVGAVSLQQWQLVRQLPQLYDFSDDKPQTYWSGDVHRSKHHADAAGSQYSLKLDIGTGKYSGASLNNLASDWSGYQVLALSFYNPEPLPLIMTLRINDRAHDRGDNAYGDRFNTRLVVAPGLNHFTINLTDIEQAPANRTMNMKDIRRLLVFTSDLSRPATIYVLELRLQ